MKNKIKTILIDDESKSRENLKLKLEKYCPEVEVLALANSVKNAQSLIKDLSPNLLLLDVQIPYWSGFDLLKWAPKIDFEVIFVTRFDHDALPAIKYHELEFLLKPVAVDELVKSIKKVEMQINKKLETERLRKLLNNLQGQNPKRQKISVPLRDGREFIPIDKIVGCMADGTCTWIYLESGRKVLSSKNLGEYEKILPKPIGQFKNRFFRIHYSYLINLSFIRKFNRAKKYIELKDGRKITIAQRRVSPFSSVLRKMGLL